LVSVDARLGGRPAEHLLAWAVGAFAPDLCLASSFGPQSIVLMHMLSAIDPTATVFYLDTDLLFAETYELRDRLSKRLGMTITRVPASLTLEQQAASHGPELWSRDYCCHLRSALRGSSPATRLITGIRASRTAQRAHAARIGGRRQRTRQLNPRSTDDRARLATSAHDLPFNRLHLAGFPSVSCRPCTRAVRPARTLAPGAGPVSPNRCGIHVNRAEGARREGLSRVPRRPLQRAPLSWEGARKPSARWKACSPPVRR
jgi:phosphoadenosine phosphosulfate reductase